jgi:putative hemolysin
VRFSSELLIILALTLVNGFFSAAEIGVLSVRRTRLLELAESGKRSARLALALRDDPEQFLATVQVGITFVSASASAFGGATLALPLAAWLTELGVARFAEESALAIVVTLVSVLSIVLGELVPKSLALRSSERLSLLVAAPLHVIARCARPLVWTLTTLSNVVLRPFRDQTTFTESRLSPDELQSMVEEAATTGALPASVSDITSRALELAELPISSLLIPRRSVVAIPLRATRDEVWAIVKGQPHARYPVIERDLDAIEGYVTTRDLVAQIVETGAVDVKAIVREVPAFTERTAAVEVLRALQRKRMQLAVVVDEHGMISGVVTINDIAEELLGDILDEHERGLERIREEAPGVALVRADTPIQDVNRQLGTALAVSPDYATLSGLLMEASSRIMKPGEQLSIGPVDFEVIDATPRQVKLLRMRFPTAQLAAHADLSAAKRS